MYRRFLSLRLPRTLAVGSLMIRVIAFLLACPSLTMPAFCDQGHHHDDLTRLELGAVHFPVSCAPTAQKRFEQGVALFHCC